MISRYMTTFLHVWYEDTVSDNGGEEAVPGTDSTFSTELDRRGVPEGFFKKQVPGRIPGIHIQKN